MANLYETRRLLDEYLLFHYGTDQEILPWESGPHAALNFPVRTVTELWPGGNFERALDVGCAVGRSSFELSKTCGEVVGIDYSLSFIQGARAIQTHGFLDYQIAEEARHTSPHTAKLPLDSKADSVSFEQGDAMALRPGLGGFDIVHAANLICRLTDPRRFLERLPDLIRPGGFLLLTTPCTWLDEFTPPENQPDSRTFDWLKSILSPDFELKRQIDLPFLIREHARKFQWSVALGTLWQRK